MGIFSSQPVFHKLFLRMKLFLISNIRYTGTVLDSYFNKSISNYQFILCLSEPESILLFPDPAINSGSGSTTLPAKDINDGIYVYKFYGWKRFDLVFCALMRIRIFLK